MESEPWQRARTLFEAAIDRPPEERARFLEQACGDDSELRRAIATLLEADAKAGDFLAQPVLHRPQNPAGSESAAVTAGAAGPPCETPETIGPYRVVRRVGQGGMSTVYLALRDEDAFHRRVVVKVVRAGMESEEILARLRRERQILAGLDHPHIARLLDGGATGDGLPYFVLEYVDGLPIDRFCDQNRLTVGERLGLFLKVCAAVHCAHQNLVVHRDLKPSNILVTPDGTPKLLDFGIAKLLNPELAAASEPTAAWLRLLTPHYASPEQVQGAPVTTASDVYSLGVLLYELLTGHLPYRFESRSPREIERILTTQIPPQPSIVVTRPAEPRDGKDPPPAPEAIGHARRSDPKRLCRRLTGDLDSIVLKALRSSPQQRYASAAQLAEDLDRYRRRLPVRARQGDWRYRAGKFLRRHRLAATATAALLLVLSGFVFALVIQAAHLTRERDRAEREHEQKNQVLALLQEVFQVADPDRGGGARLTVREALDLAEPLLARRLAGQPLIRAELLHAAGVIYANLGAYERARRRLEEALSIRSGHLGPSHLDAAATRSALALVLVNIGEDAAAERQARAAVAAIRAQVGDQPSRLVPALNALAEVLCVGGGYDRAEPVAREAAELARRLEKPGSELARALGYLAQVASAAQNLNLATDLYRESVDRMQDALGDDHPALIVPLNNLGSSLRKEGRLDDAEHTFYEVLTLQQRHLGETHPGLATTYNNLSAVASNRDDHAVAAALLEQAVTVARSAERIDPDNLVFFERRLAESWIKVGRADDGVRAFRDGLPRWRSLLGTDHWLIADAESRLGAALTELGRFDEAEPLLVNAYQRLLVNSKSRRRQSAALERLTAHYERRGQLDQIARFEALLPPNS